METDKLEAFSDGCIAIFITIILLTFHAPDGGTYRDLLAFVPSLLCYLMSFIVNVIWFVPDCRISRALDARPE